MPATILIVDDEKHTREGLMRALEDDYDIFLARDADEAIRLLDTEHFDVVLTDLKMAGKSGMSVVDHALKRPYRPICIMMTAYGSIETAVEAMRRGAFDFMMKPVNLEKLEVIIRRALKSRTAEPEAGLSSTSFASQPSLNGVVGHSPALERVLGKVEQVAPTKATVLLLGETGTGKELIAQLIHQNGPRANGPFVPVHCAALASNLLESELFGHEKGAFTGAGERRVGRFEAADGGTLFLDEIGEIDASTQVKLLRFLENKTFERLGSIKPISVDIRLVCATNRNLEAMVKEGTFREDLFYRLNVIPLTLPPLRERVEDIPLLLNYYLEYFAKDNGVGVPVVAPGALRILERYRWPGNIRELKNFCENMVVMKHGASIAPADLDPKFTLVTVDPPSLENPLSKEENERKLIREALLKVGGNRTRAAELLGISRRTLHRKLQQWPEVEEGLKNP